MDETTVKCGVDNCNQEFPERLKDIHFEQSHAVPIKEAALAKMKPLKGKPDKGEKKVNLVAQEAGVAASEGKTQGSKKSGN